MDKDFAAQAFDTEPKNVRPFTIETPEGREVKGFICKSRRFKMGSLIIDTVDGVETGQYVQGMPKIGYMDNYNANTVKNPTVLLKNDGSNVVGFPLIVNGEVEEVLFKTRGMPNVQNKFMKRVNLALQPNHMKAIEKEKVSFSFEAYGYENPHEINYRARDIPIALDLITTLEQGKSFPYSKTVDIADRWSIPMTQKIFEIKEVAPNEFDALPNADFLKEYGDYMPYNFISSTSIPEIYNTMEELFNDMNNNFIKENKGGILIEGAVWHYEYLDENHMLKNKATDVKEGHIKRAKGIPMQAVKKAFYKAKDEIGIEVEDSRLILYIMDELKEEYPADMVLDRHTRDKIHATYVRETRAIEFTDEIEAMAQVVEEEVGKKVDVTHKMKAFGRLYPDKKRMGGKLYQYFTNQR